MKGRWGFVALVAVVLAGGVAGADVTIENRRLRLVLGDDASVRSPVVLPSGEETLEPKERLPLATVTQERFYNGERKLTRFCDWSVAFVKDDCAEVGANEREDGR